MQLALGHPLSSVASLDYSIEHNLDICVQKFRWHILVCCPEGRKFIAVNGTQLKDKCHIKCSTYRRQSIRGNFQQKNVRRVESLNLIFKIFWLSWGVLLLACKIATAEAEGDDVHAQDVEVLFRDVVFADWVLEGEVELVVFLHHGVAVGLPSPWTRVLVRTPGTVAINVDLHVFLHAFGVLFSASLKTSQ